MKFRLCGRLGVETYSAIRRGRQALRDLQSNKIKVCVYIELIAKKPSLNIRHRKLSDMKLHVVGNIGPGNLIIGAIGSSR